MPLSYPTHFLNLFDLEFSWPIAITMMVLHCVVGLTATRVASRKGADTAKWLLWGLIGGTVALITALKLPPRSPES
ncbi:MAG: hypothetical protein AAFN08_00880 [Cyanobacteria bacterium J06559_3]